MTKRLLSSHNLSPELAAAMHRVHHPGELGQWGAGGNSVGHVVNGGGMLVDGKHLVCVWI